MIGQRIQDRLRGWAGLRWEGNPQSPWSLREEIARAANYIDELEFKLARMRAMLDVQPLPTEIRNAPSK